VIYLNIADPKVDKVPWIKFTPIFQATKEEWEHITSILDALKEEAKAKAAADKGASTQESHYV
jgi:hypothetical protein